MKKQFKFPIGSYVYDMTNKCYGLVLNNYGNENDGGRGGIRLDSDGNQPIFQLDDNYNEIGYNLIPLGKESEEVVDYAKLYVAFQAIAGHLKNTLVGKLWYVRKEGTKNDLVEYSNDPHFFVENQIAASESVRLVTELYSRLESFTFDRIDRGSYLNTMQGNGMSNAETVYHMLVTHRKMMTGEYFKVELFHDLDLKGDDGIIYGLTENSPIFQ